MATQWWGRLVTRRQVSRKGSLSNSSSRLVSWLIFRFKRTDQAGFQENKLAKNRRPWPLRLSGFESVVTEASRICNRRANSS